MSPSRLWLLALAVGVLLVQGYHPWAEDGGLYVAGVEYLLNPALFPHERMFVTEPLGYSVFAPVIAGVVRLSHLSLPAVLLGAYLVSILLTLFGALRVAELCLRSTLARWTAVSLLGAWWTLPVAGTSLLLMDPYVTARSFSTPLSMFAIAAALEPWDQRELRDGADDLPSTRAPPALRCGLALVLAGMFHPLMAGYALGLVLLIRLVIQRASVRVWVAAMGTPFLVAFALELHAGPESPAAVAAAFSRYYWFLSQWQWFEWLGLLGPVLIFGTVLRWGGEWVSPAGRAACRAGLVLALLATAIALLFAQEHFSAHPVARLQPLRAFLGLYVLLIVFAAGWLVEGVQLLLQRTRRRAERLPLKALPIGFVGLMAGVMFCVQGASFSSSLHLELPGRINPNPWTEAFRWSRAHTPADALFALDARYVNTAGEDAQTFRAIAERSAIPDFSKDGGEAANSPKLADEWRAGAVATGHLSRSSDAERRARLKPFGVDWVILRAGAATGFPCPYRNAVVKVCQLEPER